MLRAILLLAGLCLSLQAAGQAPLARVFHEENKDGSVLILAENRGFVPYTIHLRAELRNMRSSLALPARLVVFPSKAPRPIVTFIPEKPWDNAWHYEFDAQMGICTGNRPDTTYHYGLPFRKAGTLAIEVNTTPDSLNFYFKLPANSPVLAAREGIVAQIKADVAKNTSESGNYIIVFHDDGSYAWYHYLRQQSATVAIGQRVAKGELIGYTTAQKRLKPLWFSVLYPTDDGKKPVRVRFR
ncbi:hypothetical protein GCM10023185_21120 [Hymenobacter saemangeumensis]|uniref:M23ase beta-sheet core domain-containing protein n=1 Tax=Hymenobacter saemangeumensis TaxID=1084522 RepID=A0ABP8IDU4_9BACT